MLIAHTNASARQLLDRPLLDMDDLNKLDRCVAKNPAFLQEVKARALLYRAQHQQG